MKHIRSFAKSYFHVWCFIEIVQISKDFPSVIVIDVGGWPMKDSDALNINNVEEFTASITHLVVVTIKSTKSLPYACSFHADKTIYVYVDRVSTS